MIRGNEDREATYFLHKVDVNKLRITIIWPSSSVSKVRSSEGLRGCSAGHSGGGTGVSAAFRLKGALP